MIPLVIRSLVVKESDAEVTEFPDGEVQVYEVAPLTESILYVVAIDEQTLTFPIIIPGAEGVVQF